MTVEYPQLFESVLVLSHDRERSLPSWILVLKNILVAFQFNQTQKIYNNLNFDSQSASRAISKI